MSIDRELLEEIALTTVSSDLYYDLADNIDSCTDTELQNIIKCNGNYNKEMEIAKYVYECLCGVQDCNIWGVAEHEKVEL